MDFFGLIWDFLFGFFIRTHHYLVTWYQNASDAGFVISKASLIGTVFWVTVACASAMVAMTFAEMKFRNRFLHGALGLICPVIYPVVFYFTVSSDSKKKAAEEEEKKREAAIKDALPESELKAFSKTLPDDEEVVPHAEVLDQAYFTRISKDELGNLRGPFILELDDDQILEIAHVLEALPPAVAVQIGEGEKSRKIRLPYAKITSCMTKAQWLAEAEEPEEDNKEEIPKEEVEYEEGE